jgi:multicomponent Na+:H+ antiporter subunit F
MMPWVTLILLVTAGAGLWRVIAGPTTADRLLAIQMMGTTGIAVLLAMAEWKQSPVLLVVALVLALLAAVVVAAMVQLLRDSFTRPKDLEKRGAD